MITNALEHIRTSVTAWGSVPAPRASVADFSDDIRRHFRERYPIFLDGALPHGADQDHLVRQARESLANGGLESGLIPAAILREALESVPAASSAAAEAKAAITAVGPRLARVWWDESGAMSPDVLAALGKARPVLRFYDVTGLDPDAGRWHHVFDMDVTLADKARTVDFWSADRRYVVDLGLVHSDGRFLRLARTNPVDLPRDCPAGGDNLATVRAALAPRDRARPAPTPDAAAREWILARPDHPDRDVEAETLVHQLYRLFLRDGPRILRAAVAPKLRDGETLRREFAQRTSKIRRAAAPKRGRKKPAKPDAIVVVRLDSRSVQDNREMLHLPVPVRNSLASLASFDPSARSDSVSDSLLLHLGALEAARGGRRPIGIRKGTAETKAPTSVTATFVGNAAADPAVSVFAAAEALRRRLSGLEAIGPAVSTPIPVDLPERRERVKRIVPATPFGGAEARRFARAGVRIDRMSLTLEGRMRPGAKLKIAGQLIQADADGSFRVECALSGRKAAIPLRAGTSIGGEVRSVINLDWEERARSR